MPTPVVLIIGQDENEHFQEVALLFSVYAKFKGQSSLSPRGDAENANVLKLIEECRVFNSAYYLRRNFGCGCVVSIWYWVVFLHT